MDMQKYAKIFSHLANRTPLSGIFLVTMIETKAAKKNAIEPIIEKKRVFRLIF